MVKASRKQRQRRSSYKHHQQIKSNSQKQRQQQSQSQKQHQKRKSHQKRKIRRTKSKRRRTVRRSNNNQMGGSPAYRMHQQEGFLSQTNPHARNLPLSQPGTNVNKPIYHVSH